MPLPPAADPAPGGVSAALWASARPAALACAHTPFMRRLADGSLPPGVWRDYIGQDFFFVRAFKAAYDAAAAAAGDGGDAAVLRRLSAAVDDELQLHKGVAAGLQIDLASIVAAPATASYCAFLAAAAATGHVPAILSAMSPCSRLYGWLGVRLADAASAAGVDLKAHPYGDWVRTYASADYHAAPAAKEALLDRLVAAGGVDQGERGGESGGKKKEGRTKNSAVFHDPRSFHSRTRRGSSSLSAWRARGAGPGGGNRPPPRPPHAALHSAPTTAPRPGASPAAPRRGYGGGASSPGRRRRPETFPLLPCLTRPPPPSPPRLPLHRRHGARACLLPGDGHPVATASRRPDRGL